MESTIFSTFKRTADTRFSTNYKKVCLKIFASSTDSTTVQIEENCGFVVNENISWTGFSPDVIIKCPRGRCLLETKCLKIGKKLTGLEFCRKAPCLNVYLDGTVTLKKKYKFYGQIQLGLAVCNLQRAKLLLYVPQDRSCVVVDVDRDDDFIDIFLRKLLHVYIDYFLPYRVTNSHRDSVATLFTLIEKHVI